MARAANPLVLALDVGTSALKAGLCAADGRLVGSATVSFGPVRSGPGGRAEADASEWLAAVGLAARELAASGALGCARAVVVSGQGPSLVPIGGDGTPVGSAMLWLDRRAEAEAAEAASLWGRHVEPWYFLPKALWLARHEPARYAASRYLISCPELVALSLCGEAVTMLHTDAFRAYYWDEEILSKLGLGAERFPRFVRPGEVLGPLRSEAAARLGLPPGIPVVAGGADFLMSLLGTATVLPGRGCDRAGSSEGINVCAASEVRPPGLLCHPHVVPPYWNVSGMVPASGLAVAWLRRALGAEGGSYDEFFAALAAVPPGARGLRFRPFGGAGGEGELVGLTRRHGPAEMARAVVDAVGVAIRRILRSIGEAGIPVEYLAVTGGQARVAAWNQIKADVCGVPVRVPEAADAELVGGAAVAFVALGEHASLAEASGAMVRFARTCDPDPKAAAAYDEMERSAASPGAPGSSSSR